jgi:hypothetical protein
MAKVYKLEDIDQEELFTFCKEVSNEDDHPASENMWKDDWQNDKSALPYLIYIKKRLQEPKGQFYVLKIENKIVAVAGVYISDFDDRVAIGGVRSWVVKEYRGKFLIGKYILPCQLKWAKEKNCALFFLTFNNYNKNLINIVKRGGLGRAKNRTPDMLFYNGVNVAPFTCKIQTPEQWVVYDIIDSTYEFDWEKIRYHK